MLFLEVTKKSPRDLVLGSSLFLAKVSMSSHARRDVTVILKSRGANPATVIHTSQEDNAAVSLRRPA